MAELRPFDMTPPTKWRAGFIGEKQIFFDCAHCEAEEPVIAGVLSEDGTFRGIGVITKPGSHGIPRHFPAVFCKTCWDKRKAG